MTAKILFIAVALAAGLFAARAGAEDAAHDAAGSGTPFNFKTTDGFNKTLHDNCNGVASCATYLGHCLRQPGDAACGTYLKEFPAGAIKLYDGDPDVCSAHPKWPTCAKVQAQ